MGGSWQPGRSHKGREKNFLLRDHARHNFGVINGLGHDFGSLPALLFGLGMLGFDAGIPTMFSLAASRLPAANLPQAFRVLAVALVPASWLVPASASFAQADPRARTPRYGQTAVSLRNVTGAHGRCFLPRESSGRMLPHSPRALSKTRTRRLPASLSSSREQDREINGLIDVLGTRTPSAARQTIIFSRTGQRDRRSHRRAGNKNPERCSPNDRNHCRIRDRSQSSPTS